MIDPRPASAATYAVHVSARGFTRLLIAVVAALVAAHLVIQYTHYQVHPVHHEFKRLFDVDEENNFPTWYSWTALLLNAALLCVISAAEKQRRGDRDTPFWYVLSGGFFWLSLDEDASIHEALNAAANESGHTGFSWTTPAMAIVAVLALLGLRYLWRLPPKYRWWFVAAGFTYVMGAVGMERLTHDWLRAHTQNNTDTLDYNLFSAVEETLEMLGVVAFIAALLSYGRTQLAPPAVAGTARVAELGFVLPGRRIVRILAGGAAALIGVHLAVELWNYHVHEVPWILEDLFFVGQENNIPSWFACALMLFAGGLAAVVARDRRRARAGDAGHWLALALVLAFLSLAKDANLADAFTIFTGVNWTIPAAIAALVVGLGFWNFLTRLPAATRRGLVTGGALYLLGALGSEWLALQCISRAGLSPDSMGYAVIVAAKQSLEMSGMIVTIATLLARMSEDAGAAPGRVPMALEIAA